MTRDSKDSRNDIIFKIKAIAVEVEDIEDQIHGLKFIQTQFEDTEGKPLYYPEWDEEWAITIKELEDKRDALIKEAYRLTIMQDFRDRAN